MVKRCSVCGKTKKDCDFYYRSDKPHLLQSHCKMCIKQNRKNYRIANIEKFKLKDKIYHSKNREKINKYLKKWQTINKEKRKKKYKERYKTDVGFVLRSRIHNRIRMALKRNSKCSTSIKYLGCTIIEFRKHFESNFDNTMSWDHFLNGSIHIDHIIPCSIFDLSKYSEQLKCFNYKNLQPLWAKDNILKRDKEVYYR